MLHTYLWMLASVIKSLKYTRCAALNNSVAASCVGDRPEIPVTSQRLERWFPGYTVRLGNCLAYSVLSRHPPPEAGSL